MEISSNDIVLAEDDKDEVTIFELALDQISIKYKLRHAENGEILFVLLKELVPDILFLDIHMPCKDGITCITEIRADSRYDEMPVIMYSGTLNSDYVEQSYRKGANFFIEKANSLNELKQKLSHVFSFDWKQQMVYPNKSQYKI